MILQIFFTCIYLFIYICVYVKLLRETYTVNVFFWFHLFKGVLFLLFLSVMYMFCGLMFKKFLDAYYPKLYIIFILQCIYTKWQYIPEYIFTLFYTMSFFDI